MIGEKQGVRVDYDPYGRRTKISGSYDADFGYTGHFHEQPGWMTTGLNLAWFRAYDPELGRWLSRDPIEEEGGLNLYGYAENDPTNLIDPLGLEAPGGTIWVPAPSQTQPRGSYHNSEYPNAGSGNGSGPSVPAMPPRLDPISLVLALIFMATPMGDAEIHPGTVPPSNRHEGRVSNHMNDKAKQRAQENGTDECTELKKMKEELNLRCPTKKDRGKEYHKDLDDIIQAEKAAGCRNQRKRKSN